MTKLTEEQNNKMTNPDRTNQSKCECRCICNESKLPRGTTVDVECEHCCSDSKEKEEKYSISCSCHHPAILEGELPFHSALINLPCPHCEDKNFKQMIYKGKEQKSKLESTNQPQLTEEQKELLKNWRDKYWKLSEADENSFSVDLGAVPAFIQELLVAKDLEAEQKVEEAVRNERERCQDQQCLIDMSYETTNYIQFSLDPEPPKD